jgi:hypothetical protein
VPSPSRDREAIGPPSANHRELRDLRLDDFATSPARPPDRPIGVDARAGVCTGVKLQTGGFYNRQGRNNRPDLPLKFRVRSTETAASVVPGGAVVRAGMAGPGALSDRRPAR